MAGKNRFILGIVLSIFLISMISADVCCEKTKIEPDGSGGAWCQNAPEEECDEVYLKSPNLCEDTVFCKLGCCIDEEQGLCTKRAAKQECTNWKNDETCNVQECQEGCCIWGENTQFITERRCEYLSLSEGYMDWSVSEEDCRHYSLERGACVLEGGRCSHTTEEDCINNLGGTYYNAFCSAVPDINCFAADSTGCADEENLYDVYNFDSCGNREDIAEECNYPESMCVDGACKNLGCDEDGDGINERKNTESWCVYDAYVGESKDVVGSIHWRRWCKDGEIKSEFCHDPTSDYYRNSICAEKTEEDFSTAQCRLNLGFMCYGINDDEECEDNPDCRVHNVYVDEYFHFSACVPKYPSGFDVNSGDDRENGKDICALGTQTCTMSFYKPVLEGWKCEENCACNTPAFEEQMNDFCISLGDCGGYINFKGEYSQGFEIDGGASKKEICKVYEKLSKELGIDILKIEIPEWCYENPEEEYKDYLTKENTAENIPQYMLTTNEEGFYPGTLNLISSHITQEYQYNLDLIESFVTWIGLSKKEKRTVTFTCLPWKPPVGGDNCSKCNDDLSKPCNEYRCSSLGTACGLINTNYEHPVCVDMYPDDVTSPVIFPGEILNEGYEFQDEETEKVKIRTDAGGCIQEFSLVSFTLKTNEYAQCKYNFERTDWNDFEDTGEYPKQGNEFIKNSTFEIRIPYMNESDINPGNLSMYIRCRDTAGNLNVNEYIVNFCITEGPDFVPPVIRRAAPENKSFLKYGAQESSLEIYLNEPADCRYSTTTDTNYDNMPGEFTCDTVEPVKVEYSCSTLLQNLEAENRFYIKCRDHPEFEDDEDETNDNNRNTNQNDYSYVLYVTENELKIVSVSPETGSVIKRSPSNRKIDLEATTSGGVAGGISKCKYKFTEQGWSDWFYETDSTYHKQIFTSLSEGNYEINIICQDAAENTAYESVNLTIEVDSSPPIIISNFTEGNNLILTTNEDAECYYNLDTCNFDFENGTSITTALSTEHTIYELNLRLTYHVKCADVWGNENASCTTIINPAEENDYAPPVVVRAYHEGSSLKLITNEKAKCYYDLYDCGFNLEEGISMTTAFSTEHSADWNSGWIYHIKCKDDWNPPNENSDCPVIIKASSL